MCDATFIKCWQEINRIVLLALTCPLFSKARRSMTKCRMFWFQGFFATECQHAACRAVQSYQADHPFETRRCGGATGCTRQPRVTAPGPRLTFSAWARSKGPPKKKRVAEQKSRRLFNCPPRPPRHLPYGQIHRREGHGQQKRRKPGDRVGSLNEPPLLPY